VYCFIEVAPYLCATLPYHYLYPVEKNFCVFFITDFDNSIKVTARAALRDLNPIQKSVSNIYHTKIPYSILFHAPYVLDALHYRIFLPLLQNVLLM